jgi:hypothetical protein
VAAEDVLGLLIRLVDHSLVLAVRSPGAGGLSGLGRPAAARLLGAAEAIRRSVGSPLPAAERVDVDRIAARLRPVLGEEAVELERRAGVAAADAGAAGIEELLRPE